MIQISFKIFTLYDTDIDDFIAMILMLYDTDIIGIIAMILMAIIPMISLRYKCCMILYCYDTLFFFKYSCCMIQISMVLLL